MTIALCTICGNLKHGALSQCSSCQSASTGNTDFDIVFSDHNLAEETLMEFGNVIREIRMSCEDPEMSFWAFIHFVSQNYPSILTVDLKPDLKSKVDELLRYKTLPVVKLRSRSD